MPATLLGRGREIVALRGLVAGAREHGTAVVVRGAAGIGKSALVSAASDQARAEGFVVRMAQGVPSETHLPFAGLHQLVQPHLDARAALPARQRDALLGAFGLG
jgi:hypothetical protein